MHQLTAEVAQRGGFIVPLLLFGLSEEQYQAHLPDGRAGFQVKELGLQMRDILQINLRMLKFQVDMILDIDTTNEFLTILDDLKNIQCGNIKQKL